MTYEAEISRSNPTAFLFLIDQSGSMSDKMSTGRSKAEQLADVVNRTLMNLIMRCAKSEGTRNYFEIGVIGYGGKGVSNGFKGSLGNKIMHPISEIESEPIRVEDKTKKVDDGAGGLVEQKIKFPVWFEPEAYGGTPMKEAIIKSAEELADWCDAHPNSYPPTILHITDGESTDGDPEDVAKQVASLSTNDGNILIFNLHLSSVSATPALFPASESAFPPNDNYAKMLFRISSVLPPQSGKCCQRKRF